jgi:outer membrane receptor protein involved in Fe transport
MMRFSLKSVLLGTAAVAISSAGLVGAAQAQLDEIVVTAQKKEQNLQDVPISVTAFSDERLKLSGVQNIEDLTAIAPSLSINTTNTPGSTTTIRIRGIGTTGNNPGLEAAVGFFIDGVYRSKSGTAINDLIDIERIEVLRGAQGTLFGKNTSAGAIHVITKKPTDEFEAYGDVSFGNFQSQRLRGVVNVPIVEGVLAARFSGGYNRRDGFIRNLNDGRDHNDKDRWNLRGQLLYTPTDDLEIRVIAEQFQAEEDFGGTTRLTSGALAPIIAGFSAIAGSVPPPNAPLVNQGTANDPNAGSQMDQQISVQMDWDLGFADLTTISAYRFNDTDTNQDVDFVGIDVLTQDATIEQEFFSQEARLAGSWEDALWTNNIDWMFGGFYSSENIGRHGFLRNEVDTGAYLDTLIAVGVNPGSAGLVAPLFVNGIGETMKAGQNGIGWSLFGHADIEVLDWLSVVGGARFNHERKEGGMVFETYEPDFLPTPGLVVPGVGAVPAIGNPFVTPQNNWIAGDVNGNEIQDDEWTGNVAIQVRPTDDVMAYVSYAHGYKAGGLNLDRGASGARGTGALSSTICTDTTNPLTCGFSGTTYGAEFSDTYEFGVKTNWWDGRAQLNVTLFDTRFTNFQLNTFTGLGFFITNVGVVNSRGFEAEGMISPFDGLLITGGVTYADAQYADDVDASNLTATGQGDGPLGDGQLTNSNKWSGVTTATYRHALPNTDGLEAFVHGEVYFRSRTNTGSDLDPLKEQKGWSKVNARMGLGAEDGNWTAAVWCRNCGDKRTSSVIFDSVGQAGSYDTFPALPRTWGVELSARY